MIRIITTILILSVVSLTACDREDQTDQIAGIAGTTTITELNADQSDAYCGHLGQKLTELEEDEALVRSLCLIQSAMSSLFIEGDKETKAAACEDSVDQCLTRMGEDGMGLAQASDEMCFSDEDRQGCDITIAELETCVDASFGWAFDPIRIIADKSCSELIDEEGMQSIESATENMQSMDKIPDIDECKIVLERCPGLN